MGYVNKTYLSTQFKNFADKIAKVFSKIGHTHLKSDITDFPTSMPANGGNAATVGGHTVGVNVPSNAKFTDTTYSKLSEFTDDVGYVKNTDARLTDARNAKDVYAWAKASTKPTYTASEVGLGNVGNFKAVSTVASQGLSSTEKANARANIGAGTSSFSGSYNDLSNKPTIPSVGNGTVTIKQAGTSKGTFTMNQNGNTTIELTDNNTWRGIQNNLTSDSITDSLSANQGKVLKGLIDEKTNKEVTVAGNFGISILVDVQPFDGTVGAGSRPDLYTYTILPVYGTKKETICQGNDPRLSNTSEAIVNFTSGDSSIGDSTAPAVITSGETHKSLFNKISTAVKNVRWLLSKMGTTDISSIGNGTVTDAISALNSNFKDIDGEYITGRFVVKGNENATSPAIPNKYNGLRLYYYDGNNGLRQSVIIPIGSCNIPYMTIGGIKYVSTSVNSNRTIKFTNNNTINFVITHMYAVVINT